jgi:hypothetical protein
LNEVYNKLNKNGFQSNKINNIIKYSLNYKLPQDLTVYIILFQPQQLLSVQTTTLLLPKGTLVGSLLSVTLYP